MSETKANLPNSVYPPSPEYLDFFRENMLTQEPSKSFYEELEKEHKGNKLLVYDICYLRLMSRWTKELEAEVIALHKQGTPANIYTFGITAETIFDDFVEV